MKKLLLIAGVSCLIFYGCTEIGPPINFNKNSSNSASNDSIYMVSPVPSADSEQVLVEEFTGQGCTNCPAAHERLLGFKQQYPGRINILGLYIKNFTQTIPLNGAKYDFRTDDATTIGASVYGGISSMPIAGINRVAYTDNPVDTLQINQSSWSTVISSLLNINNGVNISVSSVYNSVTDTATITVTTTYTKTNYIAHNLSIAIVEDSMVDIQDDFPNVDPNYVFTDVLRGFVTYVPSGDPLVHGKDTISAGTREIKTYKAGLNSGWVPKHCRVITFVNNAAAPFAVMQSAQCPLQ